MRFSLPILAGLGAGGLFGLVLVASTGQSGSGIGELTIRPAARMNEGLWRVARAMRAETPSSVPIIVTSGARSPEGQAAAMAYKVDHGEALTVLYDDRVAARLMALPKPVHREGGSPYSYDNVGPWAAEIRRMVAEGVMEVWHLRNPPGGLDLHTRTLSPSAVRELQAAAARLRIHALLETTPPHLHLDRFDHIAYPQGLAVSGRGLRRPRARAH